MSVPRSVDVLRDALRLRHDLVEDEVGIPLSPGSAELEFRRVHGGPVPMVFVRSTSRFRPHPARIRRAVESASPSHPAVTFVYVAEDLGPWEMRDLLDEGIDFVAPVVGSRVAKLGIDCRFPDEEERLATPLGRCVQLSVLRMLTHGEDRPELSKDDVSRSSRNGPYSFEPTLARLEGLRTVSIVADAGGWVIRRESSIEETWRELRPLLRSPVVTEFTVRFQEQKCRTRFFPTGESALFEFTLWPYVQAHSAGVAQGSFERALEKGTIVLSDPEHPKSISMELWAYHPTWIADEGRPPWGLERFSLYLSLLHRRDLPVAAAREWLLRSDLP